MSETLAGAIRAQLERSQGRACLAFVDARGDVRWQSRAEVLERAERGAAALQRLGLERGRAALIVAVEPAECAAATLAVLLRGALPLLVAPPVIQGVNSSLRRVLLEVARRSGAQLVLLTRALESEAQALRASAPELRVELGFEALGGGDESCGLDPLPVADEPASQPFAALQLTSGTTGFPRIASWEHARVLAALDGMARGMGLREDDVLLNWTPLYHDMGLVNNFLLCLVRGLPLALLSPLEVVRRPALWLQALAATGATTTWSPNFGYALAAERVREDELAALRLERVRGFWNAAERVHADTLRRFHARFERCGLRWESLRTNFGCVETIGGATFSAPGQPVAIECVERRALRERGEARVLDAEQQARLPSSELEQVVGCGRAHPGLELGIFDEHGRALPDGRVGAIGIAGDARFSGYLGEPEASAGVLRAGRVLPGDLGYLRSGELYWVGRVREGIKLQGRMLDPSELEAPLLAVAGLRKGCFAAFGLEHAQRGTEVLVVLAELEAQEPPAESADCARICAAARRAVALELGLAIEHMALVRRGTLTKTSSGKRRHLHFRELYRAGALELVHGSAAGSLG
jgi:acyl-CoA synthetase (AMP-forming)/AMP-acid ligase II